MTETNNTADEAVEDVGEEVAEATEEVETAEDNSKESDAAGDDATDEDEVTEDDEDEEPPVRKPKTNADFVALRRQKKLEKARKAQGQGEDDDDEDLDEDEDDDDVNEEDAKLIDKRIEQHLAPLKQKEQEQEIKAEIDEFVSQNPDFKPFAAKAAKWAKHPDWKNIPTKQLMHAAAGDKLLSIGAKRKVAAQQKAAKSKTGTNSGGEAGGQKPVSEMTDEEFEAEITRVKTSPRS